jgi:hypothetical protein
LAFSFFYMAAIRRADVFECICTKNSFQEMIPPKV